MANGNSSAARRARALAQLRDRHGRWINMGAKVRFFGNGLERVGEVVGFEPGGRYARVTYRGKNGQPVTAKVAANQIDVISVKATLGQKPNNVVDAPKATLDINAVDPNNFNYLSNPSVQRYGKIVADDGTKYRFEKGAWRQEGDLKPTPVHLLAQKHKTFFEDNPEPAAYTSAGKRINLETGNVELSYPGIADIRFAPEGAVIKDSAGAKYVKQADGTWIGEPNENIAPLGNGQPLTDEKVGTVAAWLEYPSSALKIGDSTLPDNKTSAADDDDNHDDESTAFDAADVDEQETDSSDLEPSGQQDSDRADRDRSGDTDLPDLDAAEPDPNEHSAPDVPVHDDDDDSTDAPEETSPAAAEQPDDDQDSSNSEDQEEIESLKAEIAEAKVDEAMLKESAASKAEIHDAQKYRWELEDKLKALLEKNGNDLAQPAVDGDDSHASTPDSSTQAESSESTNPGAIESLDIDDIESLEDGDVIELTGTLNGDDDITLFTKDAGSWVGTNGVSEVDLDDQALRDYIESVDPQDATVTRGGVSAPDGVEVPADTENTGWAELDEIRAARRDPQPVEDEANDAELRAARARADAAIAALEGNDAVPAESTPPETDMPAPAAGDEDTAARKSVTNSEPSAADAEPTDNNERSSRPGDGVITNPAELEDALDGARVRIQMSSDPEDASVYVKSSFENADGDQEAIWKEDSGHGWLTGDEMAAHVTEADYVVSHDTGVQDSPTATSAEPIIEEDAGISVTPVPGEAEDTAAELPAGVADDAGLVPQDGVVSVTDDGRKYVADAGGAALFEGDYVASRTDGKMGVVEKIEGNGKYVKVRGEDGKLYGRRLTTLDHITPTTDEEKGHTDGPQTDTDGGLFVWAAEDNDPVYVGTRVRDRDSNVEGAVTKISDDGSTVTIATDDGETHDMSTANVDVVINVEIDLGPGGTI